MTRYSGSIPGFYDRHLGPVLFEPYARDLAARLPPTATRILELACGTGRVTRHIATQRPDAHLTATDLTDVMLAEAQRSLPDARITWQLADMSALPFAARSLDTVVCQFGLMFVPDKLVALREMHRVLAPGGTLLLAVWNDIERNPVSLLHQRLAYATMPDNPPTFIGAPFSMGDAAALRTLAHAADFTDVDIATVDKIGEAVSAADLAIGLCRGNPLANELAARGIDAEEYEARTAAVVGEQFGVAPCRVPLSAHVMTARA